MTKTVDVAAGQKIASTWGNEIRDRSVQVFATPTERDAQWPNPPRGAVCVTVDTDSAWEAIGSPPHWAAMRAQVGAMTALGAATPVGGTELYACTGVYLFNSRAGANGIINGTCGIQLTAGFAAVTVTAGYTPPSGGIHPFGVPSVLYLPNAANQISIPVNGVVALTEIGTHQFFLRASSSTGNVSIPAGSSGGVATIQP
jgi:hypothetical protein